MDISSKKARDLVDRSLSLQVELDAAGLGNPCEQEVRELRAEVERLGAALEAIKKSLSIGFMDLTEAQEVAEYIDRVTAEALDRDKRHYE